MARIMMVIRPSKGGAFAHVAQLTEAFAARGHEVAICGPHASHAGRIAAEVIEVEMDRTVDPRQDTRAIARVAAAVRRFRPDLIHGHGSKGGVIARLARLARPRTPVVFTPHQYAFANYFASARERAAYKAIERALAPLASRVIGVCEAERRLAAKVGPAGRTRLVYNGVEPVPRVAPDPRLAEMRERGPVLLVVAELRQNKGIASLLEGMPSLLATEPQARLVVAGDGPEETRLLRLTAELGLEQSVAFLGYVDNVPALLAAADVFVNPAWAEAFPYSVIEAMSVGLPIVATDVGGTGEAIITGETGLLVVPHDPAALTGAIEELLSDRARACTLGERAAKMAAERFTLTKMVDGVLGVYAELGIPAHGSRIG